MPYYDERPLTEARLSSALEIQLMFPIKVNFPLGISWQMQPGIQLGTINKLVRTQTREVHRRYALGRYSFEPYDLIPGRITTSLKLEKIVMYAEKLGLSNNMSAEVDGDMLGLFGFVSGSLLFQQKPFAIQEIVHPPEALRGSKPTITTYYDVWFTSNPIAYDSLDSDQLIIQDCDAAVGRVEVSIPTEKAAAPLVRKLLPTGINI